MSDAGRAPLRWALADRDEAGALFADETAAQRHVGVGEFRGLEFLHVNARSIINSVPAASRMPFRHTINAYRGCSHACSYCVSGDTAVLMGDGTTKPMADVRPGDTVYGTIRQGAERRYVVTEVLDHWSTTKPAYRTTLEDGTTLVSSGDHRLLTQRGWTHVTGAGHGAARRPHLTTDDRVTGVGHLGRRVVSIEPLGASLTLWDITTGTGDFIANGMVSHNCFARPTHDYLGLDIGEDFERRIVVKVNAVERLRAELRAPKWRGEHIAMGTNTDPYQRAEGKYHLTQGIVRVLAEHRNPFSILTKSTLVLRDLSLLVEAAARTSVRCDLSVGTLDRDVWRATEPGTPPPDRRVDAVRRLNEAGIPCGVLVAPVLPGLSDGDDQVRAVVEACADAGAVSVSAVALHLRPGVRQHFMAWLGREHPELEPLYRQRFARGAYQPKAEQARLARLVDGVLERRSVRVARRWRGEAQGDEPTGADPAHAPAAAGADAEQLRLL